MWEWNNMTQTIQRIRKTFHLDFASTCIIFLKFVNFFGP